jgi:hypothetical protein
MAIIVTYIYRAHSSGWGDHVSKVFTTLAGASAYIHMLFKGYLEDYKYVDEWDSTEMRVSSDDDAPPAPRPDEMLASKLFSPEALSKVLDKRRPVIVYGPWSTYEWQRPFEITIGEVSIDN